jgi:glycyl-tRNA synthetase beta subunit
MFQNEIYQPNKGITMGSPISSIVAEIFLQHLEKKYVKQLMDTKSTVLYTRYVDSILIIYDSNKIKPEPLHTHMNQIHTNIKLNPTQEDNRSINFP